jgi:hypothetical protein
MRETGARPCHRRAVRWLLLVVAACGSAPPPVVIQEPAKPKAPPSPPAKVSCGDAGTILRGAVEDSRKAGPAKEAAIASACLIDRWSQSILDCIGTAHEPQPCLQELTADQRTKLDTKMLAWVDIYTDETWETAEDIAAAEAISCDDVIGDVATYTPPLAVVGEERDFAIKLRRKLVLDQCQTWAQPIRKCMQDKGPVACRATLPADAEQALATQLASIDELVGKIAAAKKKPPATYDCKAVVAAHYGDGAWKGKAEPPKNPKATRAELAKQATDRKNLIAESRKLMLAACTGETWNATIRACELIESGERCARGLGRPARWGFPAIGVSSATGIAECDLYGQAIQSLLACDKFPTTTKDAVNQGYQSMIEAIRNSNSGSNADQARALAQSCKAGDDAIRQAITSVGCTP